MAELTHTVADERATAAGGTVARIIAGRSVPRQHSMEPAAARAKQPQAPKSLDGDRLSSPIGDATANLALWLFEAFGLLAAATAKIFFATNLLSAISYLIAARIAARIGLIKTMVFTHLPANICLMIVPTVDDLGVAVTLLLIRSLSSEMDVPTRTSYAMAVATPAERPAAGPLCGTKLTLPMPPTKNKCRDRFFDPGSTSRLCASWSPVSRSAF